MKATDYVPLARRTLKELPREKHFTHMALGATGEMGEFIDAIKKFLVYGKGIDPSGAKNEDGTPKVMLVKDGGVLDTVNLTEEVADDFWYGANCLEELGVSPAVFQRAIDAGVKQGKLLVEQCGGDHWELAKGLLSINMAVAAVACRIATKPDDFLEGSSPAVQVVESLGGLFGSLCGMYGLDPAEGMNRNIAKLAKRYGDKFSDVAALNRDVGAERAVLEGAQ